jgi:ParB family chromosome partitioning protein
MVAIESIPIVKIQVGPHRQRSEADDEQIEELAASINRVGVLAPIIVRREGDSILLVAGHRRIAAAKAAGLAEIPAIIREGFPEDMVEVSFAENFFRRDLSPVEMAAAIRECIDEGIMSFEELAKGLHRSTHWVKAQASITTWPQEILQAIHLKQISVSAASFLATVTDPQYRAFLLNNAIENGATARATAAWVNSWKLSRPPEEAITQVPVEGVIPAVAVIPQAPCLFCAQVHRTDGLNYMPVCPVCLADFQQAREKRMAEEHRS